MYCIVLSYRYIFAKPSSIKDSKKQKIMKPSSTLQALTAAFFVLTAALINNANAGQLTGTVIYKDQRIPAMTLSEVEIVSERTPVLCEMTTYKGELIPLIEINEVTISGSGGSTNDKDGYVQAAPKGKMTIAVLYNGEYIPEVTSPEVVIEADSTAPVAQQMDEVEPGQEKKSIFSVNARHTFDRLGGFFFEQGRKLIRRMLPTGI